jgi:hypothetical protein
MDGTAVTQGSSSGILAVSVQNSWEIAITPVSITQSKGAVVTQANGYVTWTLDLNDVGLTSAQGVSVTQNTDNGIVHGSLTTAYRNEYTFTIQQQTTINAPAGSLVSQGSNVGTLKEAMSGTITTFTVQCASGVVFSDALNTTIQNSGTDYTIASQQLATVTRDTPTTTLSITSALGTVFDRGSDITVASQQHTCTGTTCNAYNADETTCITETRMDANDEICVTNSMLTQQPALHSRMHPEPPAFLHLQSLPLVPTRLGLRVTDSMLTRQPALLSRMQIVILVFLLLKQLPLVPTQT